MSAFSHVGQYAGGNDDVNVDDGSSKELETLLLASPIRK